LGVLSTILKLKTKIKGLFQNKKLDNTTKLIYDFVPTKFHKGVLLQLSLMTINATCAIERILSYQI